MPFTPEFTKTPPSTALSPRVCTHDCYGGTERLLRTYGELFGLQTTYVDMSRLEQVKAALKPNTKALWIETPSNPLLNIVDIRALSDIAHNHNVFSIVDNTFLSPCNQRPFGLGADLIVHSTTKYLNGHSDVVGGAIVTKDKALAERLQFLVNALGQIFSLAESLGGVESLISHPVTMTPASMTPARREKAGINERVIRLSVGLEDANDLIEDLDHALILDF